MEKDAAARFKVDLLPEVPPDDERINQFIYWGRRFHQLGLAPETTGNLSFRTGQGFTISGTGVSLGAIAKENLVEVLKADIKGNHISVSASGLVSPSRESLLHLRIYDLRPEVSAVFHVHDELVVDLADELKLPSTRAEQPGGSYELADEADEFLNLHKGIKYFVLRNHGVVSLGETVEEAGKLVESMNVLAGRHRSH